MIDQQQISSKVTLDTNYYSTVIRFVSIAGMGWNMESEMMFAHETDEHECQVCNNSLTRSISVNYEITTQ